MPRLIAAAWSALMLIHTRRALAVAALLVVTAGQAASAQVTQPAKQPDKAPGQAPGKTPGKTPAKPAPSQPAAPPKNVSPADPGAVTRGAPEVGPYIKLLAPKELTLSVRVVVASDNSTQKTTYRDPFSGKSVDMPNVTPFEFESLAVVWPLVPTTASSEMDATGVKGQLKLNDIVVSESPQLLKGYPGGVMLARWDAGAKAQQTKCRQVELRAEIPMTCSNTAFDEVSASKVPWPQGPFPAEAQSILKPQLYIEQGVDGEGHVRTLDDKLLRSAVEQWLKDLDITDAKAVPPVVLAKGITSKVWTAVQPSGEGLSFKRTGELAGVVVQPPAWTLEQGKGSEHDMTVLLAAALRSLGLPTRVVLGWDVSSGGDKFLSNKKQNKLHSWVEFCLFDEAANTINWVPIDVSAMRKTTTKPPALTRPWRYFGEHPDLNSITPFSLHFHPPTDVMSYGWPAFWGWFVTPQAPKSAEQAVSFVATPTPKRPGEKPKKGDGDDKKPSRGY